MSVTTKLHNTLDGLLEPDKLNFIWQKEQDLYLPRHAALCCVECVFTQEIEYRISVSNDDHVILLGCGEVKSIRRFGNIPTYIRLVFSPKQLKWFLACDAMVIIE